MIFTSTVLAVASLVGSISAQRPFSPGIYSFADGVVYSDNVLPFKLLSAPSGTITITPTLNDSRVVTFPKTLTFSTTNFSTPQPIEVVLADVGTLTPPYFFNITFSGRVAGGQSTTFSSLASSFGLKNTVASTASAPAAIPGCNAFVSLATTVNPVPPSPQAYLQTGSVTYADNVIYPRLFAQPGSTTTLSFSTGDSRILANVSTLTFSPTNWNVAQPIALTINRNTTTAGLYNMTLTFTITSPTQVFSVPAFRFPLSYNVVQDGLGCYYWPGCFLW